MTLDAPAALSRGGSRLSERNGVRSRPGEGHDLPADANSKTCSVRQIFEVTAITSFSEIHSAVEPADYAAFADICRAHVAWCRARYADMPWIIDAVFSHQALDQELTELAANYAPPLGQALIAVKEDEVVASGAWRRRSATACEMKRLFVTEQARGRRLGRRLALALIDSAKAEGFKVMQLDTVDRLSEAIALYESIGFTRIAPYQEYPKRLRAHMIFMEKALA